MPRERLRVRGRPVHRAIRRQCGRPHPPAADRGPPAGPRADEQGPAKRPGGERLHAHVAHHPARAHGAPLHSHVAADQYRLN